MIRSRKLCCLPGRTTWSWLQLLELGTGGASLIQTSEAEGEKGIGPLGTWKMLSLKWRTEVNRAGEHTARVIYYLDFCCCCCCSGLEQTTPTSQLCYRVPLHLCNASRACRSTAFSAACVNLAVLNSTSHLACLGISLVPWPIWVVVVWLEQRL